MRSIPSAIIYQGPSMLDGAPIVAIAIRASSNVKTGNMVQTYILRADMLPMDAIRSGLDASICGNCTHRGDQRNGRGRTCYVNIGQGPTGVFKKYARSGYPVATDSSAIAAIGAGKLVRLGTYGDPAAVPVHVWNALTSASVGHTGYTHQWNTGRFNTLQSLCMASADSPEEAEQARAAGWRTFRVRMPNQAARVRGTEAQCPASKEAGKVLTCANCRACGGNSTGRVGSIVINAHGGFAVMANVAKRISA